MSTKWYIVGGVALVLGFVAWRSYRLAQMVQGASPDAGGRLLGPSSLKAELAPSSQTLDLTTGAQGVPLAPPRLTASTSALGPAGLKTRDVGLTPTGVFK